MRREQRYAFPHSSRMGSHFLTLVRADSSWVSNALESSAAPAILRKRRRDLAPGEEAPDAPEIIRAFKQLTSQEGEATETFELYDDDDETPVFWDLAWSEWDGDDPGLPLSPHGSPAVTFHSVARVQTLVARLRESSEGYVPRYISAGELEALTKFLEEAVRLERGLVAFIEY